MGSTADVMGSTAEMHDSGTANVVIATSADHTAAETAVKKLARFVSEGLAAAKLTTVGFEKEYRR